MGTSDHLNNALVKLILKRKIKCIFMKKKIIVQPAFNKHMFKASRCFYLLNSKSRQEAQWACVG